MPNTPDVYDLLASFLSADELRERTTTECAKRMNPSTEPKAVKCATGGRVRVIGDAVTLGICDDHYVQLLADAVIRDGISWLRRARWRVDLALRSRLTFEDLNEIVDRLENRERELERHVRNWLNYPTEAR